jgi:hypothetical protein
VAPTVNVVTQEEIMVLVDVSLLTLIIRESKVPEEPHQVAVLTVDVSEYLDGSVYSY